MVFGVSLRSAVAGRPVDIMVGRLCTRDDHPPKEAREIRKGLEEKGESAQERAHAKAHVKCVGHQQRLFPLRMVPDTLELDFSKQVEDSPISKKDAY